MAKARVESLPAPDGKRAVSDWARRKLSARVATFLQVVGAHAPIRSALSKGGYSAHTHAEGLRLLVAVCAYRSGGLVPDADLAPRAAASELFDWVSHPSRAIERRSRTCAPRLRAPFFRERTSRRSERRPRRRLSAAATQRAPARLAGIVHPHAARARQCATRKAEQLGAHRMRGSEAVGARGWRERRKHADRGRRQEHGQRRWCG
jgi:hypothetical protein